MTRTLRTLLTRSLPAFLILGTASLAVGGVSDEREAWQLTHKERLQAREVLVRDARASVAKGLESAAADGPRVTIQGAAHPELILAGELYARLVRISLVPPDDQARNIIRQDLELRAKSSGIELPKDFWTRLASVSADLVAAYAQITTISEKASAAAPQERDALWNSMPAAHQGRCRGIVSGLRQARKAFGSSFDRFLYKAIAPTTFVVIVGDDDSGDCDE